jgi:hypothetical protein
VRHISTPGKPQYKDQAANEPAKFVDQYELKEDGKLIAFLKM